MKPRPDAIVIGSGFGGSINALRLAQAGRSVLVLERGRRYRPGDFPRDTSKPNEMFWRYSRNSDAQGLFEVRFLSAVATLTASGVGGGSLIYANIHIRPDADVFDDARWPRSINRRMLDPYYDKVAAMLRVAPVPPEFDLPKRTAYHQAARACGRTVFDPDQAVSWTQPGGPGRAACQLCAECEFGCQHGAKNTLDFTYLAEAERLGAQVRPRMLVTHLEASGGGYTVHAVNLETGQSERLEARTVVVSAGTLGTTELLLRSRDTTRTLPKLSARLGHGYSCNGDFLGSIQNSATDLAPWHGPDVTSVIRFLDSGPGFTLAAPTFNQPVMEFLAALGQPTRSKPIFLAPLVWSSLNCLLPWILRLRKLWTPRPGKAPHAGDPSRMTNLFAIGRDNANGRMQLCRDRLDITWDYLRENRELVNGMLAGMNDIARAYRGTFAPTATWGFFNRSVTFHSLGGCHLSDSPAQGVVAPNGEVHHYPGLFVSDGSIIPTSIGFHPVMTISALSEHIAESVVRA